MIFLHHFFHSIAGNHKPGIIMANPVQSEWEITLEHDHASAPRHFSLLLHMYRHPGVIHETTPNGVFLQIPAYGMFADTNPVNGPACRVCASSTARGEFS